MAAIALDARNQPASRQASVYDRACGVASKALLRTFDRQPTSNGFIDTTRRIGPSAHGEVERINIAIVTDAAFKPRAITTEKVSLSGRADPHPTRWEP